MNIPMTTRKISKIASQMYFLGEASNRKILKNLSIQNYLFLTSMKLQNSWLSITTK